MDKKTLNFIKFFLPFAVLITAVSVLILVTVQQSYRMSANDPQIQIAEDVAEITLNGQDPRYLIPQGKIDISKSLATYILIYDKNKKLLGTSAMIDNKIPELPGGVLDNAKSKGESRVTWEPQKGVRSAIVIKYYKGTNPGYIVVGRSLREVEIREDNLTKMVFVGFLFTLVVTALSLLYVGKKK